MKEAFCTGMGIAGAAVSAAFGGWDEPLAALVVCMAADYISGSVVALVFHNSPKSDTGSYNSGYGLKGLCRKGLILLVVLVAVQLDRVLGTQYVRDAVCIGFCANEVISVTENLGLAGVPLPEAIIRALEQLQGKH